MNNISFLLFFTFLSWSSFAETYYQVPSYVEEEILSTWTEFNVKNDLAVNCYPTNTSFITNLILRFFANNSWYSQDDASGTSQFTFNISGIDTIINGFIGAQTFLTYQKHFEGQVRFHGLNQMRSKVLMQMTLFVYADRIFSTENSTFTTGIFVLNDDKWSWERNIADSTKEKWIVYSVENVYSAYEIKTSRWRPPTAQPTCIDY